MFFTPPSALRKSSSLINDLRNLGLTTGLRVCLDAGDANSYDGSSQLWKDISGNGNDFYRGSGSGSDGADPTYTGTPGRMSSGDYFGFDGGDRFTLAQSPPAWQSGMHKAGGKFTLLQWVYVGNLTTTAPSQAGFGCGDQASNPTSDAFNFTNSGSTQNALSVAVGNHSDNSIVGAKSSLLVTNNAWQMVAVAIDVDTKDVLFAVNGVTDAPASSGSASPTTNDAAAPLIIGSISESGYIPAINGCRIAIATVWTRALAASELTSIFSVSRARFGV